MSIDPKSGIKKQDSNAVISGVARNKVGRDLAWNWLRANWKAINRLELLSPQLLISQLHRLAAVLSKLWYCYNVAFEQLVRTSTFM